MVKIIKNIEFISPKTLLDQGLTIDHFDDAVYVQNNAYKEIFGSTFRSSECKPWKRGILKISYHHPEYGKRSIRRLFLSGNSVGIKKNNIGLAINGINELCIDKNKLNDSQVSINRGNRFLFLWNHPKHLSRMGFRYTVTLGSLATIIAILSLFL